MQYTLEQILMTNGWRQVDEVAWEGLVEGTPVPGLVGYGTELSFAYNAIMVVGFRLATVWLLDVCSQGEVVAKWELEWTGGKLP